MYVKDVIEKIIDKINISETTLNRTYSNAKDTYGVTLQAEENASAAEWEVSNWSEKTSINSIGWEGTALAKKDGIGWVRITPSATTGWLTIQEDGEGGLEVLKIPRFWVAGENQQITGIFPIRENRYYQFHGESTSKLEYCFYYF